MKTSLSLMALAIGCAFTTVLGGCHRGDDGPLANVDQLNNLKGPTRDLAVELREGTNMAASPSPDGKRIVFSAQGALWVMPAGGGSATRITTWRLEPTHPVWSPDGKSIAFQNYASEGNYHIWTISPEGRDATEWTTGPFDDREPAWLPDGSALVFSSDRSQDTQYKIWSVTLKDRSLRRLTVGSGAESNPVVSPDGARLAYADNGNVVTLALGGTALVGVMGAACMIEMTYHLQLNAALGSELTFLGATLNAKGFASWFGAVFVMVTGFALFELCRRQFLRQWGRIQEEIEHEIKRGEAL